MMKLRLLTLLCSILFISTWVLASELSQHQTPARPLVIAHRGGRRWAPENTLAAFKRSLEAGIDAVELDIHRCKTGELIVIHDETVDRTTTGSGYVKDKSLQELKCLDAGSWYQPRFRGEKLPTLSEVLRLVNGKAVVFVEIKNCPLAYEGIDDALIGDLKTYPFPDKIIVISFDHQILKQFHEKAPRYQIGMLDAAIPADIGAYSRMIGATDWSPDYTVLREDTVETAHQAGLKVFPWTVNQPSEWRFLQEMHVDGIITDDPAGLLKQVKD